MRFLPLACLVLALSHLGAAAWIDLKAALAQQLIARAWAASLSTVSGPERSDPARPWPWADTWPVARLQVPQHGIDLYVLAGQQGNALAFGPGALRGIAAPGESGITVVGGHRDTHFGFLRDLRQGESLTLTDRSGRARHYRVTARRVVDSRRGPLRLEGDGLALVTCYPFDSLRPGGPFRYLVIAEPD